MKIPITRPFFDKEEYELIVKPLDTGWVVQGPYVKQFEKSIATFVGAKYAVAVNSCTSGQFIMSRIIDLKPGDEVIVPSFTWISTVNSIEFLGAKPILCDIDITTFNIDVSKIEEKITKKTKAIYPVHLFGLAANMTEIIKIAKTYNLQIVEDCACGLGSKIQNKHCGLSDIGGVLSFHPRKAITTGEGGMIITNSEEVALLASSLRDHGAIKTDFERHNERDGFLLTEYPYLGYNNRMTDIQGALGVAQSKKISSILKRKRKLANVYNTRLDDIFWLAAPAVPENHTHSYQTYCTLFKPEETSRALKSSDLKKIDHLAEERRKVMQYLQDNGVATREGTHAVHIQRYYQKKYNYKPMDFSASYAANVLTIALPFFPSIKEQEIDYLFHKLTKIKM